MSRDDWGLWWNVWICKDLRGPRQIDFPEAFPFKNNCVILFNANPKQLNNGIGFYLAKSLFFLIVLSIKIILLIGLKICTLLACFYDHWQIIGCLLLERHQQQAKAPINISMGHYSPSWISYYRINRHTNIIDQYSFAILARILHSFYTFREALNNLKICRGSYLRHYLYNTCLSNYTNLSRDTNPLTSNYKLP
jgi:hypothetical protein